MALNLLRNARLFASTAASGTLDKTNTWEIPLQSDFSFSQANETQDITVSETGATPTRGSARFNTALNPVEWSFSSYMRPYKNAGGTAARAIEKILWFGATSDNTGTVSWNTAPITSNATSINFALTDSNTHAYRKLYFYIKADNTWYKISDVQVNQAEVDFSIDSIGTIAWSGMGTTIAEVSQPTFDATTAAVREYTTPTISGAAYSVTGSQADFIVQKYTTLTLLNTATNTTYTIPITGGSLTLNNNITFLTPENLGTVNTPVASFTGAREVMGSLTCYLRTDALNSGPLWTALLSASSSTTNRYIVTFNSGGASAPYVQFVANNAMISIPVMDVQDLLSLNIEFKFLPYLDTTAVAATSLVPGKTYTITTQGTTTWTNHGASANTVGTWFLCTSVGTGTGVATLRETDLSQANEMTVSYFPLTTTTDANDTN